eukprot:m.145535 g.145535  ORF g.145535 m.145535 type:complete len:96 (+) comp38426_c0_seq4:1462-1749(+)
MLCRVSVVNSVQGVVCRIFLLESIHIVSMCKCSLRPGEVVCAVVSSRGRWTSGSKQSERPSTVTSSFLVRVDPSPAKQILNLQAGTDCLSILIFH